MGNMEYFEICEIISKLQCHNCMTYWTKGIENCTCGTCLRPSDKIRKLNRDRYDVLSIPNNATKKGPSHGARHRNTERQRSTMQPISDQQNKRKRNTHPYWIDSWIALVIDNHQSTSDGPKNTAHAWMRLRPKITAISLQGQSAPGVRTLGYLC